MVGITGTTITVAGARLRPPRHICCFFDSLEEQYGAVAPYVAEGLANGEKVLTVMDAARFEDHHRRLRDAGIPVEHAVGAGQLCTFGTDETYLAGGAFVKDRMLGMLREELARTAAAGYPSLRTCGDMRWIMRELPGTDEALAYESEVNALLDHHDATFMCVYDANAITGERLRDVLSTHTHVLIGTVVYENPYFMSPREYQRTLIARRAATQGVMGDDAQPDAPAG